jgi:MoaA/NifB/PqqE/SkfB family radical SAM enzyme
MTRAPRETEQRYRLLLINPMFRYKHYSAQHELACLFGKKKVTLPLALPLLAAMTPPRYEIKIVDEETDDIPWGWPDLVGITVLSPTARRSYQIADTFRQLGVPVVFGGSYPTFMLEETLEHADAVVAGEAEHVWGALLDDFERGALQRVYRAPEPIEFERSPRPRWDLVDTSNVLNLFVQASRGCPYDCEFCLVNKMFGRHMRCREIDDVIAEVEALPIKRVFFADDNLTMRKAWAKELIRRLIPLGVTWFCQSSVDVADDDELLDLMAEAGCTGIIVGFESLDPKALAEARKKQNSIADYDWAVRRIHSRGIHCLASFVIGFDADTLESLDRIVDFVERNDISWPMLSLLAVAPGTDLHKRLQDEGRLYGADPSLISGMYPHVHYMNMSQLDLMDRYRATIEKLANYERAGERALRLARTGWFAKPSSAGIPRREKLLTTFQVLRRFLATSDRTKRRIFFEFIKLVREGVVSPDRVVLMLMNIEAGVICLANSRRDSQRIRAKIAVVDRGPWAEA